MKPCNLRALSLLLLLACFIPAMALNLEFNTASKHSLDITTDAGVAKISTNGNDPYISFKALTAPVSPDNCIISFEYTAPNDINSVIFYLSPLAGVNRVEMGRLKASASWRTVTCNLGGLIDKLKWGKSGDYIRIDPGTTAGVEISVRNVVLRPMTADEQAAHNQWLDAEKAKKVKEAALNSYLNTTYASSINRVEVTGDQVIISGKASSQGCQLVELAPWQDVTNPDHYNYYINLGSGDFKVAFNRTVERGGFSYDRLLSRWAVVKADGDNLSLDSHAHYADVVKPVRSAPEGVLKSKKGLGGFRVNEKVSDLDLLGINSVTVNMHLTQLIFANEPKDGGIPYTYGGKTYYFSSERIGYYDRVMTTLAERGIVVSAILLVDININSTDKTLTNVFRHPELEIGQDVFYTMPNITTPEGVNLYAACLDFLANRYSDGQHGRIHHWIMHNEVDAGYTWTNMGRQPELVYLDTYIKSMRMCSNIVRQYDQHSSVLGSYTHSWMHIDDTNFSNYSSKQMLDHTVQYSKAEGDFLWGVAYHPYPQDLTKPQLWSNDNLATYDRNSKLCTFKNLEVIDDWIRQPANMYLGNQKRLLFLSENGTNSPSYDKRDLELQAAGAAWAWKKLNALPGIDAVQWHAWIDNRHEFGLHIGLRKFPDQEGDPWGIKPVWKVWQAAGTKSEDKVFKPYLKIIGIKNWKQIFHQLEK